MERPSDDLLIGGSEPEPPGVSGRNPPAGVPAPAGAAVEKALFRRAADAVLISPEDLAELEETLSVLSDPHALAGIREADSAYARGDGTRSKEAIKLLRG